MDQSKRLRSDDGGAQDQAETALDDEVAEAILRRILDGLHSPGTRLTEREIVEATGCTHAGAREALHHLEKAGAVRIMRNRGAVILGPADAPADEVLSLWNRLLTLLESIAGSTLQVAESGNPVQDYLALVDGLDTLGARAKDSKLSSLLKRVALQRAITRGGR